MSENGNVQTLEQGDIWFLYRPRIEEPSPEAKADVQRLYMVLAPSEQETYRLAVIGRKELPEPQKRGREKHWGFIDKVYKDPKGIRAELEPEDYGTKTRGERHLPAARPAGEGIYRIVRHDDHTHLVYALELPRKPAEVQEAFHIADQASYIISVKNPTKGSPPQAGLGKDQRAKLPKHLQERFEGRRFINVDPPQFLDKEGVEFVLVSASEDVKEELGIDLRPERETAASADVFKELRLDRKAHPVEPLVKGEWA